MEKGCLYFGWDRNGINLFFRGAFEDAEAVCRYNISLDQHSARSLITGIN
jgi:hypothetical protein